MTDLEKAWKAYEIVKSIEDKHDTLYLQVAHTLQEIANLIIEIEDELEGE